ncbi:MAG: amino acid adenylation domain-containing protein [Anaerolineae bacterium]
MAAVESPHLALIDGVPWRRPAEIESSIPARFERVAASEPDAPAVMASAASLTYGALNRAANRLAHALLSEHGPLFDQSVGFLFEHGAAQIIAMLGILKAGGYYVPVDLMLPEAMNQEILADAQCRLIVTSAEHLALAQTLAPADAAIINLSALAPDLPATNPDLPIGPDRLANLHYTSGSTGKPKGVMQNHRNLLHFMATIAHTWPLRADDRIAHLISCSFSAAMMPIWGALLNGAAVAPFNPRQAGVAGLVDWLEAERITIYFSVPALYRRLVERLAQAGAGLPDLRLVILGGEPLLAADVESFRRTFTGGSRLLNIYAGAEMYYVCQHTLDRDTPLTGPTAPIGFAVEGKEVLLLDADHRPVGPDEVGEIAVRSRYLASGYLNQPALTAAAFLPDPDGGERRIYLTGDLGRRNSDGSLVHMGRRNAMLKVRGQRVELGAVEHALRTCPGVVEAVVVPRDDARGEKVLVAYAVRQPTAKLTAGTLRAALRERLPEVMVPQYVVFLDALPTTPGGKVNLQALPDPPRARRDLAQAFVVPRDELETWLAGLIEELIAVSPIGVLDHFGDLGMDSLNFMRLALQIESQLGQRIDLTLLAARPTLERLAEILRHPSTAPTDGDQVTSAQEPTQRIDRRGRLAFAVPLPPLTPETSQELLLSQTDLPPTTELISFERNGQRRSLLAREMLYHHVAEGILAGEHYMIAFCGLCGSGVGFTPVIDGKRYHYVDAGIVNGTAILRDMESSSLWDSITGECYEGDLAGARLAFWPIEMTTVAAELAAWPAAILLRSGMGEEWLRDRAWMVDGWGLASQPEERSATFEHAFDPRLPPMTLGLGVMDAQYNARFYPLQALPPKQALDDTWQGRPLQIQRHAVTGVPEARWRDDGERPTQTLIRWYGFGFIYPGCEIAPRRRQASMTRTLSGWLRRLLKGRG